MSTDINQEFIKLRNELLIDDNTHQEFIKLRNELHGFRIQSPTQERIYSCFKSIESLLISLNNIKFSEVPKVPEDPKAPEFLEVPKVPASIISTKDPRKNSLLKPSDFEA